MDNSEFSETFPTLPQPDSLTSVDCTDEQLRDFYARDPAYLSKFEDKHLFTDLFLRRYHSGLFYYKHYYDDVHVIGNPETCREAFYFVPGFNGTPGQMRFGLPSLIKRFGSNIYLRSLYLKEFSSRHPTWTKYTEVSLQQRRRRIIEDLREMSEIFPRIRIIVSSTGFYDFLAAYSQLENTSCEHILYWVSCAPDQVSHPLSENIFYQINGFTYQGQKWFSYPNHQLLRFINPECSTRKRWKHDRQRKVFYKNDLESRFFCGGLLWDYASWECITFMLRNNLDIFYSQGRPIDLETHVLAATKDGFWDDSSPENIEKTLSKYLVNKRIIYKKTSHLWVVTPENISQLIKSVPTPGEGKMVGRGRPERPTT